MEIKLNLGCGADIRREEGVKWINIDTANCDLVHDLRLPLPFYMNTVDYIYSSHLVEHFNQYEWIGILKDWYRALKWGATLEIHCPDLEQACRLFLQGENKYTGIVPVHGMIYGSQENPGQMHKQGFDKKKITDDLTFVGFREVRAFNTTGTDDWELTCTAIK